MTHLRDDPGRTKGCYLGAPSNGVVCTDHITWCGETVHIASGTTMVAGMWIGDKFWPGHGSDVPRTKEAVLAVLAMHFAPSVSDEEIAECRRNLEHLTSELEEQCRST